MRPTDFQQANKILGKPKGWDDEKDGPCIGLPAWDTGECFHSVWEPSDLEREAITRGEGVILTVWGRAHPPVSLCVTGPELASPRNLPLPPPGNMCSDKPKDGE